MSAGMDDVNPEEVNCQTKADHQNPDSIHIQGTQASLIAAEMAGGEVWKFGSLFAGTLTACFLPLQRPVAFCAPLARPGTL